MGLFDFLKRPEAYIKKAEMENDAAQEYYEQQAMTPEQLAQQEKETDEAIRENDAQEAANIAEAKRLKNQPY